MAEKDYSTMNKEALLEELGAAYAAKDMKLMSKLAVLVAKAEAAEEKAKKDELQVKLQGITVKVRSAIDKVIQKLVEDGTLDGADGVWFAYDMSEKLETGINPACRLIRTAKKAKGEGGGSGKSSYVAGLPSSDEMLKAVGDSVMFDEDTTVTIDKVEHTMTAGTTYRQAYEYSTNGGWRNRVRMALGKASGNIQS
ncbi:MAG: hypothetical protein M0R06_00260 [Sphaerochaeta sp.]|nr:hypothetical protein [Sphaerochaeta sp.]